MMKAVIFDLDGTLLDTIADIADAMNCVLANHGLPMHSVDEYKIFVGDGAANLIRRSVRPAQSVQSERPAIGAELGERMLAQFEVEYRAEYLRRQTDKTMPYAGIPELLSTLAERGVRMAVLSNKPHNSTVKVMEHYFPGVAFGAIIGQRAGCPIKPDPAGVMEILDILGLARDDALYVGDTGTDMLTAKAAGVMSVGALWGFRDKRELLENGAMVLADSPLDVLKYI